MFWSGGRADRAAQGDLAPGETSALSLSLAPSPFPLSGLRAQARERDREGRRQKNRGLFPMYHPPRGSARISTGESRHPLAFLCAIQVKLSGKAFAPITAVPLRIPLRKGGWQNLPSFLSTALHRPKPVHPHNGKASSAKVRQSECWDYEGERQCSFPCRSLLLLAP